MTSGDGTERTDAAIHAVPLSAQDVCMLRDVAKLIETMSGGAMEIGLPVGYARAGPEEVRWHLVQRLREIADRYWNAPPPESADWQEWVSRLSAKRSDEAVS